MTLAGVRTWRGARVHEKSSSTEAWAASWDEGATEWLTTPATGTAPACLVRVRVRIRGQVRVGVRG